MKYKTSVIIFLNSSISLFDTKFISSLRMFGPLKANAKEIKFHVQYT